jgi:hypothetical protein
MITPADDQSDAYKEALEYYDEYIIESAGPFLAKKPSAKQKAAILEQIIQSHEEEDFDLDVIFEQHARDCFKPLYFKEPDVREEVARIMSAFLATNDPNFDEILLNDEDPPLHIGQLLKKPSLEQLAEVVKALQEDDPNWSHHNLDFDRLLARHLVLILGNNFPELIKQNSRTQIIFGNPSQDSANIKPPPLAKAKKEKKKNRATFLVLALVLLCFWVFKPFRSSPQSDKISADKSVQSQPVETAKQGDIAKEPHPITTLENVALPITLVSVAEFPLLDNTGKQTTIPVGSIVSVESRSPSGTLTTRINGGVFVGNEERLAGKVKEKID